MTNASPYRAAYMKAIVDLTIDKGFENVTVEMVVERAGGSVADFEAVFSSMEDCAMTVFAEEAAENMRQVREAYDREAQWPDSLRAAAYAHARWIAENPKLTRFGTLELLWTSETASALRDRIIGGYVAMVDAGREVAENPESIPTLTAESIAGSIKELMARNSDKIEERDPGSAVPVIMYLAVRPYLGEAAAQRELTIPPPGN
jgi:AcrR family transcriptional regulator